MTNRVYYRTVKDNKVKLNGHTLECDNLKQGELDGKRFAFIPYPHTFIKDYATVLWGTEEYSLSLGKEISEEELEELGEASDLILSPDGRIRWYFWQEVRRGV